MSLDELVKIFEREIIADFSEVGKKWDSVIKEKGAKKQLKDRLKIPVERKIEKIKIERLKFLDSDPNRVLTTAMAIAGFSIANELKRSQIRKILDIMQNIKKMGTFESSISKISPELVKKEVARMRFLLAYSSGRNSSVETLQSALEPLLGEIKDYKDFEKVYEFFQSILAFHYFLGGGE